MMTTEAQPPAELPAGATAEPSPLFVHGKVSYLEIPAVNPHRSATFYAEVFGWRVELRDGSAASFAAPGDVIGHFVTSLEAGREPGVLPFVYVDDVRAAIERVTANGGGVVRGPYPEGDLTVARVSDPDGNVIGVWEGVSD